MFMVELYFQHNLYEIYEILPRSCTFNRVVMRGRSLRGGTTGQRALYLQSQY